MEGASNKGHAGDEQGDVANEGAGVRDLGSSRAALFRNRLLDLLLADGLQLLVLRGAKNFLQLRRAFVVDGPELLHFLHWQKRRIVLDRFDLGTFFLEDRQHLDLLFRRKFELLRQRLQLRRRVGGLARRGRREGQKRKKAHSGHKERERLSHGSNVSGNVRFAYWT